MSGSRIFMYSRVNPADRGGVQTVFRRLAAHLRGRGHTVIVAWAWPVGDDAPGDESYVLPPLVWRRGLPAPRSALSVCRAVVRLVLALFRHRPQIVNVHYVGRECLHLLMLRRVFRYKLVLSLHGSDVLRPQPWNVPALARVLPEADLITTVSRPAAARTAAFDGVDAGRVHVVPNGIDYEFWTAAIGAPPLHERPPTLLAVGRLHPVKGHDVLLRAFAPVHRRLPQARLVIIGDGPRRAELERLAGRPSLQDVVEFAGGLEPEQVRARLAGSRAFVLPSRSEGLPLTLLEAMAGGVPVVATAVGAVPEVAPAGAAVLVPSEDEAALSVAILEALVRVPNPAAIERARRRAKDYSAAAANDAYERLLDSVLDPPPGQSDHWSATTSTEGRTAFRS